MKVIIMAGGRGARFWPRSQPNAPKQCIKWGETPTLLIQAVNRARLLCGDSGIYVITGPEMVNSIRSNLDEISFPATNVLIEPSPRNTAPCTAFAIGKITPESQSEPILIIPADHLVQDAQSWAHSVLSALAKQNASQSTILFGIQPSSPHTGYGYIESDRHLESNEVGNISRFIEKPDLTTATKFIKKGNYLWNAGMILSSFAQLENAFKAFLPGCHSYIVNLREGTADQGGWLNTESTSLDYGILEKLNNLMVVSINVGWSDLGSWDAAHLVLPETEYGHGYSPKVTVGVNSKDCVVLSEDLDIAIVGLDRIAVVQHGNQLLVLNLDESQSIRHAVSKMESLNKNEIKS